MKQQNDPYSFFSFPLSFYFSVRGGELEASYQVTEVAMHSF